MVAAPGRIEFGGPDLPARRLRDLLQRYVDQSPPGSRIDWATYYFRDRALAQSLIRASDRGVRVELTLEWSPRRQRANDPVIAMLERHGIGGGLRRHVPEREAAHLHAKIYTFSSPDIALVGSFNPSGDEPEDRDVIADIGDQDRGHNLLLSIERPRLTSALRRFVGQLGRPPSVPVEWRPGSYRSVNDGDTSLYFYPRQLTRVIEPTLTRLRSGDRIRGAISHLKKGLMSDALADAAKRGASVELLVHHTERRVSPKVVERLQGAGVAIRRVSHPQELPMHAKFLLVEGSSRRTAWLGSYNFNERSRLRNAELLLATSNSATFDALANRFHAIAAMSAADEEARLANPAALA